MTAIAVVRGTLYKSVIFMFSLNGILLAINYIHILLYNDISNRI